MNLFSTEQITKYHPDKVADQISDAILTEYLWSDRDAHVACETLVKGKTVVLAGEILSSADIDRQSIARQVMTDLGYDVDQVIDLIGQQSPEIDRAVRNPYRKGAGDQGMMYGYACKGPGMLPYGFQIANELTEKLESLAGKGVLKGDAKVQITTDISHEGWQKPIQTVLISACHEKECDLEDVRRTLMNVWSSEGLYAREILLNPSGRWTIGGPEADCGLTGRKIVCDQYGGYIPVGGGAFSGKDPSKVDRSGAYMARKIACDIVKEFECESAEIQLAYAIGVSDPVSINVRTTWTGDRFVDQEYILRWICRSFDLTPQGITDSLQLLDLDYRRIAEGCHMKHF